MRPTAGLLMLIYLAVVGYALVTLPPKLIEQYNQLAEEHPNLGFAYLAVVGLGALILAVLTVWIAIRLFWNTRTKRVSRRRRGHSPSELSAAQQRTEITDNLATGGQMADDEGVSAELRQEIRRRIDTLEEKRDAKRLEIVAFGTISSGKSSLLNALAGRDVFQSDVVGGTTVDRSEVPWPGKDQVVLVDTPGLAEVKGESRAAEAASAAKDADLVLFVVDGPLKAYERDLAAQLAAMEKRVIVCLNKEDWFPPDDRLALIAQITEQVATAVATEDIVAIRSRASTRRRVRVLPDGSESEEIVSQEPDIAPLARRMLKIIDRDGRDLLLANLLLQSRGMVDDAKAQVTAALDRRADELISKYMWAAGSATAINPIPLLDLAGGSAITVKLVLDLARIYKQSIDVDTVVTLLSQLGKNLVAMLGATAVTPALASGVATVLKTIPGVGTIAGGLLQGLVQAVVTRWIGRVFCTYYKNEMKPPPGGLAELARNEWATQTTAEAIRKLVVEGRQRWGCEGSGFRV